jgi:hypothetical protein
MTRSLSKNVCPPAMLYGAGVTQLAEYSDKQLQQELTRRALLNGDWLGFELRQKCNDAKLYVGVSDYGLELELSGYKLTLPAQSQQLADLALVVELAQQAQLSEAN